MPEDRFDDKIRELLNDAHEEYDNSSWEALRTRLEEQDSSAQIENEEAFIPSIKETLESQKAEVNESHWETLKAELERIQDRRERLYVIKILEAAVVLLLILTYFNYKWHSKDIQIDTNYLASAYEVSELPELHSADLFVANNIENNQTIGIIRLENAVRPLISDVSLIQSLGFQEQLKKIDHTIDQSADFSVVDQNNLARLSSLPIHSLEKEIATAKLPSIVIPNESVESQPDEIREWTFGIPFSYDVNFINTDINLGFLSHQIRSGLGGASVGLSMGYRMKFIELESGIRYSKKDFRPGLLTNYSRAGSNSYLESQLDKMEIHQFQIPLLAKLYAAPTKRNSFYGVFGFAINAITANTYDITRTVQPKAILESSPLTQVIDLKKLPQGIAQGGSLFRNLYITSVIGFGVQSDIGNGVTWYFQPQYQHSFTSEINELVTQINALNIEGGLRFAF